MVKKKNIPLNLPEKTKLNSISYPPKVLLAWKEAISGNIEIRDWLTKNGYKELGVFCFALINDENAKKWLERFTNVLG